MQEIIDELLENALENGYDLSGEEPMAVAMDLVRYSSEVENESPEDLVCFVENWQARKKSEKE